MKKTLLSLLLAVALCLSLTFTAAAAEDSLIWDDAGLLAQWEIEELNESLQEISQKHQAEIRIITTEDTSGSSDDYINYLYDSYLFGYGENRDGVLLLVCMDLREFRIHSNGFAGDAIGPGAIDSISDAITQDLSDGEYADAFATFIEECDYYIDGHLNGFPFDYRGVFTSSLLIGAIIGFLVAMILKGQLKTVRKQNQANSYVRKNSMQVTQRSDLYLYRHVSRTKKETTKSSSGSGSGGSRNVGGGSF